MNGDVMNGGGGISNSSGPGSAGEPSMEEIIASIRRVLKDDGNAGPGPALDEDVLVLDAAMMAKPPEMASGTALPLETEASGPGDSQIGYFQTGHIASDPELSMTQGRANDEPDDALARSDEEMYMPADQSEPADMSDNIEPPESLIGDEARESTKGSIGALVRSLGHERNIAVSRGGITIEDIVREEIRPMLKAWLDTHLPTLVERIVRAEIERVVDRTQV